MKPQSQPEEVMQSPKSAREVLQDWVEDNIDYTAAKRMHELETRIEGPAPNRVINYAKRVGQYKQHLAHNGLDTGFVDFVYKTVECAAKDDVKDVDRNQHPDGNILKALVELRTGGYRMTPEEYEALQQSTQLIRDRYGSVPDYGIGYDYLQNTKPREALQATGFDEFKEIMAEALRKRGVPTELPEREVAAATAQLDANGKVSEVAAGTRK